jgi:hypothetical protein
MNLGKAESGFTAIEIILAIVALAAIGTAVFFAMQNKDKAQVAASPTPTAAVAGTNSPAASAAPSPTNPPATSASCQASELTGTIDSSGAAAGTYYWNLGLKNAGSRTCTLYGYPGVSLVDASGNQLGQPAERNPVNAPKTISLAPGQSASAQFGISNPGNFEPGKCTGKSAALRVYPPGETKYLQVTFQEQYCPGFNVAALAQK